MSNILDTKKHILLIATGGTIACKKSEDGLTPLLTSDELVSYVPLSKEFCIVKTEQLMNIDSTNMGSSHWLEIALCIQKNYESFILSDTKSP